VLQIRGGKGKKKEKKIGVTKRSWSREAIGLSGWRTFKVRGKKYFRLRGRWEDTGEEKDTPKRFFLAFT